jgi:hypothetical protein
LDSRINQLLIDLKQQLLFLDTQTRDILPCCEKGILICIKAINELKEIVSNTDFASDEDEIYFFKVIKPEFISKLIYYNSIYKFESKKPRGGNKEVKKYIQNELEKLKRYFVNNNDFYKYYSRKNTSLDKKYFIRGNFDIKLDVDSYFFETDHSFATSHDFKVAKILAHDLVEVYLENKLKVINSKSGNENSQRDPNAKLTWTAPKVALIELIYALQTEGVFNNGTADVKDLTEHFEKNFNIDLGQYRRTFLEIRARKTDRPRFIQSLKEGLEKRMDNSDEAN